MTDRTGGRSSVPASQRGADGFVLSRTSMRGVVLDLAAPGMQPAVAIAGSQGRILLRLGSFGEEDVIAVWRRLADSTGLVPMVRTSNGTVEALATQLGRIRLGRVRGRRALPIAGRRRPRFLVRRKGTRLPMRPQIYREPELAAGRGR